METVAERIARKVNEKGGRAFYVGGYVRDRVLGIGSKDVDIEVHGIEPDSLYEILQQIGEPLSYGKSFGVYSLAGEEIDIAMPRRERAADHENRGADAAKRPADHENRGADAAERPVDHENHCTCSDKKTADCTSTGGSSAGVPARGHRDFEIEIDPYIGTYEAARRRDFTINALMQDVLTGEIIDHFGGLEDLQNGIIRHIDAEAFVEDPLRVLRAAQFAARFGFTVAPETIELCRGIDLSALSRERVEEELKKALLKADKPSIFFETLRSMDQLGIWFTELEQTIGLEQDPVFHPEGDVWTHSMQVLDRAAANRSNASEPYRFMLFALVHDLGKISTTERIKGRIHSYEHETKGLPVVESFARRVTAEKGVIDYLLNMVPLHMRPNVMAYSRSAVKSTNKLFDLADAPEDLIYFADADRPLFSGTEAFSGDSAFLFERLSLFNEMMEKPYVMGRDLIDAGLEPGEDFGEILDFAHKLRLAGIEKELALKQALAYARKLRRERDNRARQSESTKSDQQNAQT